MLPRDQTPRPDIFFLGTPQPVVDAMLELAEVEPGDVLYDLGSGDGRIPITAAKRYGIRAVGIEIDPEMVAEARANARAAGVSHLVTFVERDLFLADIGEASIVTLYLLDRLNLQLRPKLLRDLAPGSRIVAHQFGMGDWRPDAARSIGRSDIYLWRVPALGQGKATRRPEKAHEESPAAEHRNSANRAQSGISRRTSALCLSSDAPRLSPAA